MRVSASCAALISVISTFLVGMPAFSQERLTCASTDMPPALVVAIDGTVNVTPRSGETLSLGLGDVVCPGDKITTGAASRVELQFERKNTTTGASSNTTIVIPVPGPDEIEFELITGRLRFISSIREFFKFRLPGQDGGIDGTEAVLAADGPAGYSLVLMVEGLVTVTDRRDPTVSIQLAAGEASFAGRTTALIRATPENVPPKFRSLLLNPDGASDWAIHYPPILLAAGVTAPAVIQAAALFDGGDPDGAEAMLIGLSLSPRDDAAALALRAIAAVYRNKTAEGAALADAAVARAPDLGAAHIAQSYALQARGQLEAAGAAAEQAAAAAPGDAYAWARLAELHLTIGERRAAREAVRESLALAETALGRTIEGFAALSVNDHAAAGAAFHRAIEIDSEAPLPRLGLGLSAIRQGRVEEGRREIETAVALDPRRASQRTWLGRAYFEEGLSEKAAAQFALAKEADPDDPNAYLFTALERFAANDPIGALRQIEAAKERGQRRSTVRSQLGLDEDRAVRGAALARIYDTLGFEPLATVTGARAAEADPGNPEAHFFLSDAFRGRQGFEIAQSSELLVGQLLSPPNRDLIQPRLAEADLGLLESAGPSRVTFSEFAPLIAGDGVSAAVSGAFGTQETFGAETSISALYGPFSLAFGQFHSETDGFRTNNFVEHDVYSLEARLQISPELDLFAELRRRDSVEGDRIIDFNDVVAPNARDSLERDSARIGIHYEPAPGHDLIALATFADQLDQFSDCAVDPIFAAEIDASTDQEGFDVQGRYLGNFGNLQLTLGGNFLQTDRKTADSILVTPAFFGDCSPAAPPIFVGEDQSKRTVKHFGGFGYLSGEISEGVEGTIGFSTEHFDNDNFSLTEVNPKAGIRIELLEGIEFRAAYARTLKRPQILDQTLEPTTIAGFNQFFDDGAGAVADLVGIGLDAQLGSGLWLGAGATRRWVDTPLTKLTPVFEVLNQKSTVTEFFAYGQATIGDNLALSVELRHERFHSDSLGTTAGLPRELDTTSAPIALRWFDESGVFASMDATFVHQSIVETVGGPRQDDQTVLFGASLGYRLPAGRGLITLEARNLFDTDFAFRDQAFATPTPQGPRFARDRSVFLRATFAFGPVRF